MVKKIVLFSICTVVILSMSSCASIMTGAKNSRNNHEVLIEGNVSEPVTITTSYKEYKVVQLPKFVEIDRHKIDGQHIKIESPNYVYQDIVLQKKLNGWVWGNLFLPTIPGILIDIWSNNVVKPKESRYEVKFQPK